MNRFTFSHLDDQALLRDLASDVAKNCLDTGYLLARLAEVDARKLFLPAAHPSMHSYCVHVLGLSEDSANKRIRVARKARECPALLEAIADGRLHLSGAALLASRLTPHNADELLSPRRARPEPRSKCCWLNSSLVRTHRHALPRFRPRRRRWFRIPSAQINWPRGQLKCHGRR